MFNSMQIEHVKIENYKCFKGKFSMGFKNGVNILVGNNEAGKSTILEATHLAITGMLDGRYLRNDLSQYLFNCQIVEEYLSLVNKGKNPELPRIQIEVFFAGNTFPQLEGNWNSYREKRSGIVYRIEFDPAYEAEYEELIKAKGNLSTIPIEYYRIVWKACSRDAVTARSIPVKSALIDSSSTRYQNGSDIYISRIIRNELDDSEKIQISQAYRRMKDGFMQDASIQSINKKIAEGAKVSDRSLNVSVDLSTQNSWEKTLMTYLDEVPFHQIGKGEQCVIKTNLALAHKKSQDANLILLEEPENHLSHTRLNGLIRSISENCKDKQLIITTHSSFVANKLGLENLHLIHNQKVGQLSALTSDNLEFFKKLPGYQTLRLLLCKKAVLVEGDSDELIFQRAYMDMHNGRLPIEDGIDVISVKLTFKRFLEIAVLIEKAVAVITDNDDNHQEKVVKKYKSFEQVDCISIFADTRNYLNTLEPQMADANKHDLDTLRDIIGITKKDYPDSKTVAAYMENNKTQSALRIFEAEEAVKYPQYILNAVNWSDGE